MGVGFQAPRRQRRHEYGVAAEISEGRDGLTGVALEL
jgi:hypothetical protein